jgi:histidinol phosphatase-like PHP family hydrolase
MHDIPGIPDSTPDSHRETDAMLARIVDCHNHTDFAYCGEGLRCGEALRRVREAGLAGVCFTEHAPQIYCTPEEFWGRRHIDHPETWKSNPASRAEDFRAFIQGFRAEDVYLGLEVELDSHGKLTLRDEDRDWPDLFLGAIHWLPADPRTDEGFERDFLRTCEGLVGEGVDILAHPMRAYSVSHFDPPRRLYRDLAKLLARNHVAAEVNYHFGGPDEEFFRECLDVGVRFSIGTDAHVLAEVGRVQEHVAFLRRLIGLDDFSEVLYRPAPHAG